MLRNLVTLFIPVLIFSMQLCAQGIGGFNQLLDNCGLQLSIPKGFSESPVIENHDMEYDYAVKYPDRNFELRYAVRPISLKNYPSDTVRILMDEERSFRNTQYAILLQTVILNISGGVDYEYHAFDAGAVKNEFNADWGATVFLELNSEFGKGFRYCMIVAIHRHNVADAYYFYLSDTREQFMENVDPLFHSLKFE